MGSGQLAGSGGLIKTKNNIRIIKKFLQNCISNYGSRIYLDSFFQQQMSMASDIL